MSSSQHAEFEWRAPLGAWRWLMLAALGLGAGDCGGEGGSAGSDIPTIDFPCDGGAPLAGGLRCDGGVLHREAAGACASRWSPLESISVDSAALGAMDGFE